MGCGAQACGGSESLEEQRVPSDISTGGLVGRGAVEACFCGMLNLAE